MLTGFLATADVNSNLISAGYAEKNGLAALINHGGLWGAQLKAISVTLVLSVTGTILIACLVKALVGLRPVPEAERQGLDITDHGEEGYIL